MRFGKIALLSAFVYASVANAQDVMVDLSVLDDLDTPYTNELKPLFPVLSKKAEVKVKKPLKKNTKSSIRPTRRHKPKKTIEQVKPLDADAVVVDVEPVSEPKKVQQNISNQEVKPKIIEKQQPVAEEPKADKPNALKNTVIPQKIIYEPTTTDNAQKNIENSVVDKQDSPEKSEIVGAEIVAPKEELLIKENEKNIRESEFIRFENDVDELNEAQMLQIDTIVSTYENTPKNKIAIYSYNLDNGVDSFKRKRTSLNRAVNVRSYLLKKGYKNFSIKVININSVSDKQNMVELQEI